MRPTSAAVWIPVGLLAMIAPALSHPKPVPSPPVRPKHSVFTPPTAEALFVKVLRSDDLFSYKGRQITTYWRTGRTLETVVSHRPLDDRRIQFLNPEPERGRLLVGNDEQQWEYSPREKVLRHRPLSLGALDDDDLLSYNLLRANYLVAVASQPRTTAERRTFLVMVKRPVGGTLARRFWIDSGSGLILKREIYNEAGKLTVTAAFTDIAYHPAFPAGTFTLAQLAKTVRTVELPSAETAVALASVHAQLSGHASAPATLAGYRLVGATATKIAGRPVLHLRYSDGLNLVSLFEQRRTQPSRPTQVPAAMKLSRIGATPIHVAHRAALTTLNWDTPVLNMTLMGEQSLPTLRALAQAAIQGH